MYIYIYIIHRWGKKSNFLVSNQGLASVELRCIWRPDGTVVAGTCCALSIQRSPRPFFWGRANHTVVPASIVSWIVIPLNYSYNLHISQQTLVNLVSESSYKAT